MCAMTGMVGFTQSTYRRSESGCRFVAGETALTQEADNVSGTVRSPIKELMEQRIQQLYEEQGHSTRECGLRQSIWGAASIC